MTVHRSDKRNRTVVALHLSKIPVAFSAVNRTFVRNCGPPECAEFRSTSPIRRPRNRAVVRGGGFFAGFFAKNPRYPMDDRDEGPYDYGGDGVGVLVRRTIGRWAGGVAW